MKLKDVFLISFLTHVSFAFAESSNLHPDSGLNVAQLIIKYGYPFENHTLITSDGYILELHRIPHGKSNMATGKKGTVLMMPGLWCDSSEFVLTGNNSFAFILADQGYDVWLGNNRGTTWSRKHLTLDPSTDNKFWNFSLHELAYIDVAAKIDYILQQTQEGRLFYIGHSQGTLLFFILTSTRPEYNSKIRLMTALAPAIHIGHMTSILKLLNPYQDAIQDYLQSTGTEEFMPRSQFLAETVKTLCNDRAPTQSVCLPFIYLMVGFSRNQLDPSLISVFIPNIPAGASFKQFKHLAQIYNSKTLKQFDYGSARNKIEYGQSEPPKYNINQIATPVAAYYGENDNLVVPEDAERAIEELPNVVQKKLILGFNHMDLTWGRDAPSLIFNDVLKIMERY